MRIKHFRIRNFRSIVDLSFDLDKLTTFCGPNSCGKSNIIQAIQFAFKDEITQKQIHDNLTASQREKHGAPKLSIWIDITFINCPPSIKRLAKLPDASEVSYNFRAMRSGKIVRSIGNNKPDINKAEGRRLQQLILETLNKQFNIVYVPPIRDLQFGLAPFQTLLSDALKKTRGTGSLKEPTKDAKKILRDRADRLLSKQDELVKGILNAKELTVNTAKISLDNIYEHVSLDVKYGERRIPLEQLGTGHQSSVIIHLYRQLGELTDGHTLFLFEEPDNHLHPPMIRAIGEDLQKVSEKSQVILTTHSPVMINYLGYKNTHSLYSDEHRITQKRVIDLSAYNDKEIRSLLVKYGIRATEAMLSKKIIVVEGKKDVIILYHLIELFHNSSPDHRDVVIVPAGGKPNAVELCKLLNGLGVDWVAIFDWDAAIRTSSIPYTRKGLSATDSDKGKSAIEDILRMLDSSHKRGRNIKGDLERILSEFEGRRPSLEIYRGSEIEDLITCLGLLLADEQIQLIRYLKSKKITKYLPILFKARVCVWSGTIEDSLLRADGSYDILERILRKHGVITDTLQTQTKHAYLKKRFKENAIEQPLLIEEIMRELYGQGKFNRTEVKPIIKFAVQGLENQ